MATKKCPFCAEEIQEEAIKCRYCLSFLSPPPLAISQPKSWVYRTIIYHYRNMDESGWLNAEQTPAAQASQHFWNEFRSLVIDTDNSMIKEGWQVVEPRDPSCLKIESVRNAKGQDAVMNGVAAVFTLGVSLIGTAIGFYKWWPSSLSLRYKKEGEEEFEETFHMWWSVKSQDWKVFNFDPVTKQYQLLE